MTTKTLTGSCLCGAITYTSTAPPTHLDYCYCLTCQKVSGAPFMAWTGIPKSALTWTFHREPFRWRAPICDTGVAVSERVCCGSCGCNIILQYDLYPEKTHVAATTVAREGNDFGAEMPELGCHIWCRHVPSWHRLPEGDGVPRYEEFDEVFGGKLEEHLKLIGVRK